MTILLFLFGVAVAAGLFFILADILKLPRLSTEKALLSAGRAEKKRMRSLDAIFLGWAIKLSKYIRMDEDTGIDVALAGAFLPFVSHPNSPPIEVRICMRMTTM